ncbi:conserved hypothetical protein [Thermocrinis minervae]|uniref:Purine nucleoside phosphorylase n=2 Tax=Thermocrinis minervae TaxID=381751 RepID=A0A1M6SKY6_9AQUI|nr:conserved hypothetical protein [Thermocrinis minervae]
MFSLRVGRALVGLKIHTPEDEVQVPKQIHSDKVLVLEKDGVGEGDAIITQRPGIKIGVRTADCVPVVLVGEKTVGVIHAGWRGLHKGILEKAHTIFSELEGSKPTFAFIGPSAKACCYQVGEEFKSMFESIFYRNLHFYLDTALEARKRLIKLGVKSLVHMDICSICSERFPSYRRDKTQQRLVTFVELIPT